MEILCCRLKSQSTPDYKVNLCTSSRQCRLAFYQWENYLLPYRDIVKPIWLAGGYTCLDNFSARPLGSVAGAPGTPDTVRIMDGSSEHSLFFRR